MKNYCFVIFTLTQIHHGHSKPAEKREAPTADYFSLRTAVQAGPEGLGREQPPPEPGELPACTELSAAHGVPRGAEELHRPLRPQAAAATRREASGHALDRWRQSLWAPSPAVPPRKRVILGSFPPSLSVPFLEYRVVRKNE